MSRHGLQSRILPTAGNTWSRLEKNRSDSLLAATTLCLRLLGNLPTPDPQKEAVIVQVTHLLVMDGCVFFTVNHQKLFIKYKERLKRSLTAHMLSLMCYKNVAPHQDLFKMSQQDVDILGWRQIWVQVGCKSLNLC